MQPIRLLFAALLLAALTSCTPDAPHTAVTEADTEPASTVAAAETETSAQPPEPVTEKPETLPTPESSTTAAESTEAVTSDTEQPDSLPPEPPVLPEILHTNIDDPAALQILSKICDAVSSAGDVSVYFTDVEEEYRFGIGEKTKYHTASTVKAVYCQYLLAAGTDLDKEITLTQVSRTSSSGKLNWNDIGSVFTVGELMEYSIRYSDNQAHRLLYETFGIAGYNRYVAGFGSGGLPMDDIWEWSMVTPEKLSRVMLEIYRYGRTDSFLTDLLKSTDHNSQIPAGTKYETAHKYGTNGGTDGYHDTAIVYAPGRPYVLTVMTNIDTDHTEDPDAVFRRTAELCDQLHTVLFGAAEQTD